MALNKSHCFEAEGGVALINGLSGFVAYGKSSTWFSEPHSQKVTYSGTDVDYVEFFSTNTQVLANRVLKITLGYTAGEPTSETWEFFDTDGSTVLESRVYNYTLLSGSIQSVTETIS